MPVTNSAVISKRQQWTGGPGLQLLPAWLSWRPPAAFEALVVLSTTFAHFIVWTHTGSDVVLTGALGGRQRTDY